jgi:hypothetical protein
VNPIKCPLSAYNQCSEQAQVVQFGEHTKSAKRGRPKVYIRCPVHGSIRMDKDEAQAVIRAAAGDTPPAPATPKLDTPPKPEPKPILDEWGF